MHICKCGGVVRQHPLVGNREAWTCNECGRYAVIERCAGSDADKIRPTGTDESAIINQTGRQLEAGRGA